MNADVPVTPSSPAKPAEAKDISDVQVAMLSAAAAEGAMFLAQLAYETGVAATIYITKGNASPEYAGQIARMREVTGALKRILGPVLSL